MANPADSESAVIVDAFRILGERLGKFLAAQSAADYQPASGQPLMRATEAARYVGIGKSTLYSLRNAGEFASPVMVGKKPMYRREDLDAYIANLTSRK